MIREYNAYHKTSLRFFGFFEVVEKYEAAGITSAGVFMTCL
jgi:hypothetical protein